MRSSAKSPGGLFLAVFIGMIIFIIFALDRPFRGDLGLQPVHQLIDRPVDELAPIIGLSLRDRARLLSMKGTVFVTRVETVLCYRAPLCDIWFWDWFWCVRLLDRRRRWRIA